MLLQQLLNGVVVGGVYALFAVGFNLVFGVQRLLNLAHGAVFMTGAFVAYYTVRAGGPLILGFVAAAVASGVLAMIIEVVCFRRLRKSGDAEFGAIISSMGAGMVIMTFWQWVSQTQVLRFPFDTVPVVIYRFWGLRVSLLQLMMAAAAIAIVLVMAWFIYRTAFGRQVRAVTDSERASMLVGINPNRIYNLTYFISGALAGAAGVLVGLAFNNINFTMGEPYLMFGFAIIILGGLGSIPGALMASLIFGMVQTLSIAYLPSGLTTAFIFSAMFLILLVRPNGLMGREEAGSLRGRR
ncbi:branched-chain amino acid ABC transporter permease [Pararhodobacter aggregans]|uniref:Branched-chain amino acid ABC transporter permease n=1 Tax=Pararhodobacter aggregans TaxID=404875 RepID=A0A2T7UWT7_9RHOB|nr:branched-chain amino acid ABC transporter permease [Pararhodobacter aggregans]PTX04783.1 amino acid/amide ABC transporter membrane protein 1 (HAAT family) [Pararhodobacter aggregans]PVE49114.1 branched-chain amino acid ABC transporter permease [Pararhodobacter aggregans]